jgi:Fe-S cluster biogenesis protein NfuA
MGQRTVIFSLLLLFAVVAGFQRRPFPARRLASSLVLHDFVRPAVTFALADVIQVDALLAEYDDLAKIQGVYAIQDAEGSVRYVGASTAVASDVRRHLTKHGAAVVNSVRIQTFANPNQEALDAYKLELVRQTSAKGNLEEADAWEDKAVVRSVSDADPAPALAAAPAQPPRAAAAGTSVLERLIEVVDVDSDRKAAAVAAARTGGVIDSPFAAAGDDGAADQPDSYVVGPTGSAGLLLTKENVDKVLDEIRPYLIADGGNVAVVAVDDFTRSISLTLQGACGSCPSSTVRNCLVYIFACPACCLNRPCPSRFAWNACPQTTMKMGIERVLKENFANLGPVISVDPASAADSGLTADAVMKALEKVLPAIKGLGGSVEVSDVEPTSGTVKLRYKGPARLKLGIELVLKDVSAVKSVEIEVVEEAST